MEQTVDMGFMPGKTQQIFKILATQKFVSDFILVGGTALAIQIKHRLSEDLDLLFDGEELPMAQIKRNILKVFPGHRITRQDHPWQIDFSIEQIRVTFFSTGAIAVPAGLKRYTTVYNHIRIATPRLIGALKFSAIARRNTIRDYYDLYMLTRDHYTLMELISFTKQIFPNLSPITYTETLVYTKDIEEEDIASHLSPAEIITKEQIAVFFTRELIKIKEQI